MSGRAIHMLPIKHAPHLRRIAGGSETDVYRTDDQHYVLKLKTEHMRTCRAALADAQAQRAAAEQFAAYLGPAHSVPSYYVVAHADDEQMQVVVIQPYLTHVRPLVAVSFDELNAQDQARLAAQLRDLVRRTLTCYRETGHMPDLHGSFSGSVEERTLLDRPAHWPRRVWQLLVTQSVLGAYNLLLTDTPECRVVLVDYDIVRWGGIIGQLYYALRWMLFWRDHLVIFRLGRSGQLARMSGGRV
jgi:hypothetical protein